MAKVQIGLVQMSCSADKQENLDKAIARIREAASKGAQIVCLQELFTSLYFCDVEDYDNFKLAEPIPGPSTEALVKVAAELNVVIIASLFEKRTQGIYHNTTAVIDADGTYMGKYRKCIFLMILPILKNSTSRRVILGTKYSKQNMPISGFLFVGTSGILKERELLH